VRHFVGFVLALNEAVKGRKLSDHVHESQPVRALLEVRLVHSCSPCTAGKNCKDSE